MKVVVAIMSLFYALSAFALPIIPQKLIQGYYFPFKSFVIDIPTKLVTVTGPKYHASRGHQGYQNYELDLVEFLKYRHISLSSYIAKTGDGRGQGSAFLISDDIIVTNQHVADTDDNARNCGKFSIRTNVKPYEWIGCQKVLFCDVTDMCVIQMKRLKNGKNLSSLSSPLSLASHTPINSTSTYISIGNAKGAGIQVAKGKGAKKDPSALRKEFIHYAPTLPGNSGSPLISPNGLVVGLNFAHSYTGNDSYINQKGSNYAVRSDWIIKRLKKFLTDTQFEKIKIDKSFNDDHFAEYEAQFLKLSNDLTNINMPIKDHVLECIDNTISLFKKTQATKDTKKLINQDEYSGCLKRAYLSSYNTILNTNEIINLADKDYLMTGKLPHQQIMNDIIHFLLGKVRNGWNTDDNAVNACLSRKNLTDDCMTDELFNLKHIGSSALNNLLITLTEDESNEILDALRANMTEKAARISKFFWRVRDRIANANPNIIANCLLGVKQIQHDSIIVDYDEASWLHDHSSCPQIIKSSLIDAGYQLPTLEEESHNLITTLLRSSIYYNFSIELDDIVMPELKSFFTHPFMGKKRRKAHNLKVLKSFLDKYDIESISEESILSKIKFKLY